MVGPALLVTALLLPSAYAGQVDQGDRDAVEQLIRSQVGTGRSPDDQPIAEHAEARRILVGSGPSGSAPLLVVQYTIETGNSWQLYVAVFEKDSHRLLARGRVGGKAYREVSVKSVAGGLVEMDTIYYALADALCCPSVHGTSALEVRDGQLWETDARIQSGPKKSRRTTG